MRHIFLIFLTICLSNCSTTVREKEVVHADPAYAIQTIDKNPQLDCKITLLDSVLNYGDKIWLDISLTNNSDEMQKLLFDKPATTTGGPWATSGKVQDIHRKISVLAYENKALLSSKIHLVAELEDKYYHLKPGQTINGQYALTDIVVFNTSDNTLPKGTYEVQLFNHSNPSNVVTLRIK